MDKEKGIEKRLRDAVEEQINRDSDPIAIEFGDILPDMAIALQRAALHYTPVDPAIMPLTANEISFDFFMQLIEINPEYLATKFSQHYIRTIRLQLYHPDTEKEFEAKDLLKKIASKLQKKERSHFPKKIIKDHRNIIKKALESVWKKIPDMETLAKMIKTEFSVNIMDENLIEEGKKPTGTPTSWADYIIGRLYGLDTESLKKYIYSKQQDPQFDIAALKHKIKILTSPIE